VTVHLTTTFVSGEIAPKMSPRDWSARMSGNSIYAANAQDEVVEIGFHDGGLDVSGTIYQTKVSFGGETLVSKTVRDPRNLTTAEDRMANDMEALWRFLRHWGLKPWTACMQGYYLFPGRLEYGRYAEYDLFHTLSG
jgi:hypothetical protein